MAARCSRYAAGLASRGWTKAKDHKMVEAMYLISDECDVAGDTDSEE